MLTNGYIAFAIIEVRGNNAEEISSRMGVTATIATANGATTDAMVSGLIVISRGTVPALDDKTNPKPFSVLLLKILAELKNDVRITHGGELADFGKIGDETRFAYSFIAPSFGKALGELLVTDFGKIVEIT